jgi:predicted MFS family arabinose efflux permease
MSVSSEARPQQRMSYAAGTVLLFAAIMMLDTLFAAAAAPLVPGIADEYGLSKTQIGLFVASHSAGAFIGAVLAAFASALISRKSLLLIGLSISAATSVLFGLADSALDLTLARFGHGIGSSLSWTAVLAWMTLLSPAQRLGWTVAMAWAATELGSVLGPLLGGTASRVGLAAPFIGIAVVTVPLMVWVVTLAGGGRERRVLSLTATLRALRTRRFGGALWIASLPAFILGTTGVLIPVQLADLGWNRFAIGVIYATIGIVQIGISFLAGRLADRSLAVPLRIGLIGAATAAFILATPWSQEYWRLPVCLLAIFAAIAFLLAPGTILISRESRTAQIQQGVAFSLANVGWAPGAIAGAVLGGILATRAGDSAAFLLVACICVISLAALERTRRRPALTAPAR